MGISVRMGQSSPLLKGERVDVIDQVVFLSLPMVYIALLTPPSPLFYLKVDQEHWQWKRGR